MNLSIASFNISKILLYPIVYSNIVEKQEKFVLFLIVYYIAYLIRKRNSQEEYDFYFFHKTITMHNFFYEIFV